MQAVASEHLDVPGCFDNLQPSNRCSQSAEEGHIPLSRATKDIRACTGVAPVCTFGMVGGMLMLWLPRGLLYVRGAGAAQVERSTGRACDAQG